MAKPSMSKAAMLARIEEIAGHLVVQGHQLCAEDVREVAAWLAAACVPARGHWWTPGIAEHEDGGRFVAGEPPRCCLCGQRRAEEGDD